MIKLLNNDTKNSLMGIKCIESFVKVLPDTPGVYRMLDVNDKVLYVGKAKNLKKRVSNYIRNTGHSMRILKMISLTANMDFIITETETEALLLEANLIKKLKPIYNILLRDDKSFPYIVIPNQHLYPGLYKHRGAKICSGNYYGPFANASAVSRTLKSLQQAFLLRSCSDSFFANRTRPCLLYQIKRCSAPCTQEIAQDKYMELVEQTKLFLNGKATKIRNDIVKDMQRYSQVLEFEKATIYRDRLEALSHIQTKQHINLTSVDEADVFAIYQNGSIACIEIFFFRLKQNWGNHAYFIKIDESLNNEQILAQFLLQFYDNKPISKLILVSHEPENKNLIEKALTLKANQTITINVPIRGEKKQIVNQALNNAAEALTRKAASINNTAKLLIAFKETFDLKHLPKRIEIYDNSHIMGTNAVGAMVVFGANGFEKDQYRKFNIANEELTPGDDFAMMNEILTRRCKRLLKEDKANFPNVMIIDGGKGQLSSALNAIKALNTDSLNLLEHINIIAMAKGVDRNAGKEVFHMENKPEFVLPMQSPLLYFLQNLRDEVHRFAVSSHRILRKKNMMQNPLDEIPSIGNVRKRALLHYFGSAKAISEASIEQLEKVKGISHNVAKLIFNFFH